MTKTFVSDQQNWVGRTVMVENNDVDKAMSVLNGIMIQEGLFQRWSGTRRYEKPTQARSRINYEKCKAVYNEVRNQMTSLSLSIIILKICFIIHRR